MIAGGEHHGRDLAESLIEARREAAENEYQNRDNPYPKYSDEYLEYALACNRRLAERIQGTEAPF